MFKKKEYRRFTYFHIIFFFFVKPREFEGTSLVVVELFKRPFFLGFCNDTCAVV